MKHNLKCLRNYFSNLKDNTIIELGLLTITR